MQLKTTTKQKKKQKNPSKLYVDRDGDRKPESFSISNK